MTFLFLHVNTSIHHLILSNMQILKLLDNEDMDPSELERIRDDVDYYIEVYFV